MNNQKIVIQVKESEETRNALGPIRELADLIIGKTKGEKGDKGDRGADSTVPGPQGPEGRPGKDAVVNYTRIASFVREEVSKIPRESAVQVDQDAIIASVLSKIPKVKDVIVDYPALKKFCIEQIQQIEESRASRAATFNSAGPTTRLGELVDVSTDGASSGQALGFNGIEWVPTTISAGDVMTGDTTASTPSFMYAMNGTTLQQVFNLTSADTHAIWFDKDRSGLAGGRINNGLNLGSDFSTFRPDIHVPQYGITWGWNQLNKGVTVTSKGDTTKGSVILGYNNLNSGQYNLLAGQANAVLSTGGFVAGRENVVGYSGESTARTFLVSHDNANKQVVVAGDLRAEFPVGAYVAFWQTDGVTPALSLQIVTAVSYSAPNTTITFDRKGPQNYNGNTSSWIMNITTAVVNQAAAVGYRNVAHAQNSFAAGESNFIFKDAPNGIAIGKSNSISSSADASVLMGELNSVTTGKYSVLLGYSNTNTTFGYSRAIGRENTIGGVYSSAMGWKAVSRFHGHNAQASGMLTNAGDAQSSQCTVRRSVQHVNTNWFPLYVDGSGTPPTLANSTVAILRVMVAGIGTAGSPRPRFGFSGDVVIHRTGGTYTILAGGTVPVIYNTDDTNFTCRVTNTGTAISVEVSDAGASGKTIRWVADLRWAEVSE